MAASHSSMDGDRGPEPLSVALSLERLVQTYLDRCRRGDPASLTEIAAAHPELAQDLRECLPAIRLLEDAVCDGDAAGDPEAGSRPQRAEGASRVLGDYEVRREIGRGGMGIVYEAMDRRLGRTVALKVLPRTIFDDDQALERFRREQHAAARLRHPNIVPVFGVGEHEGLHYYAMPLIEGEGLDQVIAELREWRRRERSADRVRALASSDASGDVSAPEVPRVAQSARWLLESADGSGVKAAAGRDATESASSSRLGASKERSSLRGMRTYFRNAARLVKTLADALAYAHAQGVVHRDIKPSNLILEPNGWVWVADFGLAKDDSSADLTASGDVVGTLRYLPPESLSGPSDARGDVYGLGLTLWELLTLEPAFEGDDRARLVRQISERGPLRPRALDPSIPRDLETIVMKATERRPEKRYSTAAALADDLDRFLEGRPLHARPVGIAERAWRWCRRNPVVSALSALALVLLLGYGVLATVAASRLQDERNVALDHLRDSYLAQARALRFGGRVGRRLGSLEAIEKAARMRPSLELRDEAIAAMAQLDLRQEREWTCSHDTVWSFCDATHERCAIRDGREDEVSVRSLDDGAELLRLRLRTERSDLVVMHADFSPDGRSLVVRYEGRDGSGLVVVWSLESREEEYREELSRGICSSRFHPRSGALVTQAKDGTVEFRTAGSWSVSRRLHGLESASALVFSPDGDFLAAPTSGGVVPIVDTLTGERLATLRPPDAMSGVSWNATGGLFAVPCRDRRVYVYDLARSLSPLCALEGHLAEASKASFAADGRLLLSAGWDRRTRVWDLATRSELVDIGGTFDRVAADGSRFSWHDNGVRMGALWRIVRPTEHRLLHGHERRGKGPWHVDIDPSSRRLVSSSADGWRLWRLRTGEELGHLPGDDGSLAAFFFGGGELLLTVAREEVLLWRVEERDTGALSLAASRRLWRGAPILGGGLDVARSRLALVCEDALRVLSADLGGGTADVRLEVPRRTAHDHVSWHPEGAWLATGGWRAREVVVWDARNGDRVAEVPLTYPSCHFSADGRWLVTVSQGRGCQLLPVGEWGKLTELAAASSYLVGSHATDGTDGGLLLVGLADRRVRLYDSASLEPLATLEGPNALPARGVAWSRDGRYVATGTERHVIEVWDLFAVRARLASMGLDWAAERPPRLLDSTASADEASTRATSRVAPRPLHDAGNRIGRPGFDGVSGERSETAAGDVPDGWRLVTADGCRAGIETRLLAAGELAPASPVAGAVRISRPGGDEGTVSFGGPVPRAAVVPGRHYRASFWARGGSLEGDSRTGGVELRFHTNGPLGEPRPGETLREPFEVGGAWRRVVVPFVCPAESLSVEIVWELAPEAHDGAIEVASPELVEVLWPTELTCRVDGDRAMLSWRTHAAYDALRVLRDGQEVAVLAGSATTHVDAGLGPGRHEWRLEASLLEVERSTSCAATVEGAPSPRVEVEVSPDGERR